MLPTSHTPSGALRARAPLALLGFAALTLLAACDTTRGSDAEIDADALPRLSLREELRLGSALDPDIGFTRIGPVVVDDRGNTYVAEQGEDQVRVYGPDGRRVRVIGRRGAGPGEFRLITRMGLIGDTLWVGDLDNRRVTLFSLDGRVLATLRAPEHVHYPRPRWPFWLVGVIYRGGGHLASHLWGYAGRTDMSIRSVSVPRLLFDSSGAIVDTIGFVPRNFPESITRVTVGSRELAMPLVADDTLGIEAEDGTFIVSRRMATSDAEHHFGVVRLNAAGDTVYSRSYRYSPAPFESWYLDSMAARFADGYRSSPTVDPEAAERAVREHVTLPAFQPPIASARPSEDGGLWLRRDSNYHGTHRWIILDADGAPRGQVTLPASVSIKWSAGDVVWVSIPDELEVPWLVRYRIVPQ